MGNSTNGKLETENSIFGASKLVARRACYSWNFTGHMFWLCLFCGWVFSRSVPLQLQLVEGFGCWYSWAFSDSALWQTFQEKQKCFRHLSYSIPQTMEPTGYPRLWCSFLFSSLSQSQLVKANFRFGQDTHMMSSSQGNRKPGFRFLEQGGKSWQQFL